MSSKSVNEESKKLKSLVRDKYSEIALSSEKGKAGECCGSVGCCDSGTGEHTGEGIYFNIMAESYEGIEGYQPDADMSLGCGIPVAFAALKPGQSVLDLGSGAGNDIFIARSVVGETGQLTGLDFSEAMTRKARSNAEKPDTTISILSSGILKTCHGNQEGFMWYFPTVC